MFVVTNIVLKNRRLIVFYPRMRFKKIYSSILKSLHLYLLTVLPDALLPQNY